MKRNFIGWAMGLALLALGSCNNQDNGISDGSILGEDNSVCPCCGGYLIVIDQFTYRFFDSDLPAGSTVLQNASYPVEVALRFENESDFCNDLDRISIQEITKR